MNGADALQLPPKGRPDYVSDPIRSSDRLVSPDSQAVRPHQIVASAALVFALLPIVNWIRGGHSAPWYSDRLAEWLWGTAIAAGLGLVIAILGRRMSFRPLVHMEVWATSAREHPHRTGIVLATIALVGYSIAAKVLYSGVALHLDEIAQLIQARIFADGQLYRDVAQYPEFFSLQHIVEADGKWFSQFPPGWPLMMTPFVLLGVGWLSGPVWTSLSVLVFWGIARHVTATAAQALAAVLLFMAAPFVVFMGSSHMNHVGALFWFLCAIYALIRLQQAAATNVRWSLLLGLSLGALATVRPLDAAAAALPAGIWILWRAVHNRARWSDVVSSGAALLLPMAALGWYNTITAGTPFTFAYTLQWGSSHGLGFHAAPWGSAHTVARGVELINLYFLRLQSYLFESPVPSLVFPAGALILTRHLRAIDRYLLAFLSLLLAAYFSYWHDGFYLGPRFVYLLVPGFVLWSVMLPGAVATVMSRRMKERPAGLTRWAASTVTVCVVMAAFVNTPARGSVYRNGLISSRANSETLLAGLNPEKTLIFVRETWGAQLMARLWRFDVGRDFAELAYSRSDACALDRRLVEIERTGLSGEAARQALVPLLVDSLRLVRSPYSPDDSERLLPGAQYSSGCIDRIGEDRQGTALMAPIIAQSGWRVPIARDLGPRNALLLSLYPSHDIYLLRSKGAETGAPLELLAVSRDSVRALGHGLPWR